MRISDWSSDVCSSDLIDMSIAVAVHAIADDIGREKLGLADFAMRRTLGGGAEIASLDKLQGGIELLGEIRSEERRVGKEWVSTCSSRWTPYNNKKTKRTTA